MIKEKQMATLCLHFLPESLEMLTAGCPCHRSGNCSDNMRRSKQEEQRAQEDAFIALNLTAGDNVIYGY